MKSLKEWCIENEQYDLLEFYENASNVYKSDKIAFSSSSKVNWKCNNCNIEWTQAIKRLARKERRRGCPYCSHHKASPFYNLITEYPILKEEWDYERNDKNPTEYLPQSRKKIFWKCTKGHTWEETIECRVKSLKTQLKKGNEICPYCNHQRISPEYNLATEFPNIAKQWNYLKNGCLTPLDVSPKSGISVWWTCEFNPVHTWESKICNRTYYGGYCPICSKFFKISFPSRTLYFYLRKIFPDCEMEYKIDKYIVDIYIPYYKIIIEYDGLFYHSEEKVLKREKVKDDFLKNNGYNVIRIKEQKTSTDKINIIDNTIIYYRKDKNANLSKLVKETIEFLRLKTNFNMSLDIDVKRDYQKIENLYFHMRKSNSLSVKMPEIAKEWSKNNEILPDTVTVSSSYKAKWICSKCHREYSSAVFTRTYKKTGCPYCHNKIVCKENSLDYNYPEISKEWNYDKNGDLKPENVLAKSSKRVWWKCKFGHEWESVVSSRTSLRTGCPHCYRLEKIKNNLLIEKRPDLCLLWNYEKNKEKNINDYSCGSSEIVWWKCESKHEWQTRIRYITRIKGKNKCPYCTGRKY